MKCQVLSCGRINKSNASDCSFFKFPNDANLSEKWIKFCQQENTFNPKTAHICMFHFQNDDFANNMQFDMGFAKYRLLKKGVVPTISGLHTKYKTCSERKKNLKEEKTESLEECGDPKHTESNCGTDINVVRIEKKTCQDEISMFKEKKENVLNADNLNDGFSDWEAETDINVVRIEKKTCQDEISIFKEKKENFLNADNLSDGFSDWEAENIQSKADHLRKENKRLRYAQTKYLLRRKTAEQKYKKKIQDLENKYLDKIRTLNEKLSKTQDEVKNIEEKLSGIFTKGQIKKLKNGDKRKTWLEEDIVQSTTLYVTSAKAYKLLHRKGFPLPAVRTLQRWAQLGGKKLFSKI